MRRRCCWPMTTVTSSDQRHVTDTASNELHTLLDSNLDFTEHVDAGSFLG
jgi:hypothetical protein